MRILVAAALLLCSLAARAEIAPENGPEKGSAAGGASARCTVMANIFSHVAYQRDGGADAHTAEFNVRQWMSQKGETGSHMKDDFSKPVAAATQFVYAHADLNRNSLYHYGLHSCELMDAFASDSLKQQAGLVLLHQAVQDCQKKFPEKYDTNNVRECVSTQSNTIEDRVRKARISTK